MLEIQSDAIERESRIIIADDLLATGGTANCVSKMLESNEKKVAGLLVVVELTELQGRIKLNFPVESTITY